MQFSVFIIYLPLGKDILTSDKAREGQTRVSDMSNANKYARAQENLKTEFIMLKTNLRKPREITTGKMMAKRQNTEHYELAKKGGSTQS